MKQRLTRQEIALLWIGATLFLSILRYADITGSDWWWNITAIVASLTAFGLWWFHAQRRAWICFIIYISTPFLLYVAVGIAYEIQRELESTIVKKIPAHDKTLTLEEFMSTTKAPQEK